MADASVLPPSLLAALQRREPLLWRPPQRWPLPADPDVLAQIDDARSRFARSRALLARLFPSLADTGGAITSPLLDATPLQRAWGGDPGTGGRWLLKADHALPVAGSVKARGGFHEVLAQAERIALQHGLLPGPGADLAALAEPPARAVFAQHTIAVGSTGNLGLAIGLMATALGFRAVVHMSMDAKDWKVERLRRHGVDVVRHAGDYGTAVATGRAQAEADPRSYFVDDERSTQMFAGYAVAADELAAQLQTAERAVDAAHPLVVYLPCGVGGAPGGIAYGLRAHYGEHVHVVFAEPVASPCVLVQMAYEAGGGTGDCSVYELGLDNRTEADGLAVAQASALICARLRGQLAGLMTVHDDRLFAGLTAARTSLGLSLEPSACAGFDGPALMHSALNAATDHEARTLLDAWPQATQVLWTTGGAAVPPEVHAGYAAEAARRAVAPL